MQAVLSNLPLIALSCLSFALIALQWHTLGALDKALEREQSNGTPDLKPIPVTPSVPAPVIPLRQPATRDTVAPPVASDIVQDEALVAFVKKEEGFTAHAYGDFKQYSIGYGTKANSPNEVIDEAEGDRRLRAELALAVAAVEKFIPNAPRGIKQALSDLTYNAGTAWMHAGLGSLLVQGQYQEAKTHLMQYNHAGGSVNEDLTKRRQKECDMFDNPL